jgi:hypothetical protein
LRFKSVRKNALGISIVMISLFYSTSIAVVNKIDSVATVGLLLASCQIVLLCTAVGTGSSFDSFILLN